MARKRKPAPRESSVAAAQRAANARRRDRLDKRDKQLDEAAKRPKESERRDPRTGLPIPEPRNTPGDPVGRGASLASQGQSDGPRPAPGGRGLSEAANRIAGLASGLMEERKSAGEKQRALADPKLYGTSDKDIRARLTEQKNALADADINRKKAKEAGQAVYYGTKKTPVRRKQKKEGEFEGGFNRIPAEVDVDDVRTKDELLSWLTDETVFGQIKARMIDAGFPDDMTYDEVAKVWEAAVKDAAAAYSAVGKKVTPWQILSLRAKNLGPGGTPAAKVTTRTDIEELDPAQARLLIEKSATELLGRAPTKEELEDFIAKAQTIARANPRVTKTTTQFDVAGDPINQVSQSTGGMDVVTAKAQTLLDDELKQDEEYGAVRAAGFYMPAMFDALASPV